MGTEIKFEVTLKLSEDVNLHRNQIGEMVNTIIDTLVNQVNTGGIVPEGVGAFTEIIEVYNEEVGGVLYNLTTDKTI